MAGADTIQPHDSGLLSSMCESSNQTPPRFAFPLNLKKFDPSASDADFFKKEPDNKLKEIGASPSSCAKQPS